MVLGGGAAAVAAALGAAFLYLRRGRKTDSALAESVDPQERTKKKKKKHRKHRGERGLEEGDDGDGDDDDEGGCCSSWRVVVLVLALLVSVAGGGLYLTGKLPQENVSWTGLVSGAEILRETSGEGPKKGVSGGEDSSRYEDGEDSSDERSSEFSGEQVSVRVEELMHAPLRSARSGRSFDTLPSPTGEGFGFDPSRSCVAFEIPH